MIDDASLDRVEKSLQEESDQILNKIKLIPLLQKYGTVQMVGGKALGLMIAKDIDISVVVNKVSIQDWQDIVTQLMVTPRVRKVIAIDFYNYTIQHFYDPTNGEKFSLYISVDTLMGSNNDKYDTWECQIHLIEKDKFDRTKLDNIKSKLNSENRLTILRIKYWANQMNKLLLGKSNGHYKIYSPSIYEAVLDNNISTIDEFIEKYKVSVPSEYKQLFAETLQAISLN